MKKNLLLILTSILLLTSCSDFLYSPSKNKVTDEDLLSSQSGMSIYLARMYSMLPIEDFKYMPLWGLTRRNSWLGCLGCDGSGEAVNRDWYCTTFNHEEDVYWGEAFHLLRSCNHLMEALPNYQENYAKPAFDDLMGQAYFVRGLVFYQMARRFGGIPLVTKEFQYPAPKDELEIARSSEEETWDQIAKDFQTAADLLPAQSSKRGYANKYVALAYKAEAMLYAGSVAKYNETVPGRLSGLGEKTGVRVIGFDPDRYQEISVRYFSEAYKAARTLMQSGKYSLYKKAWKPGDKQAQFQNMVDMWQDMSSTENIFVREYLYPTLTHGLDAYSSPLLWHAPLSGGTCPTLDFVEMFDGLPRYDNGTIRVTDGDTNTEGHYIMYDSPLDMFKNAEPRLRAYVILPMDEFRNEEIEVRAGIYTGEEPIKPLFDDYSYQTSEYRYQNLPLYTQKPKKLYLSAKHEEPEIYEGMTANGTCGPFYDFAEATLTGFHLRKYLDPNMKHEDVGEGKSSQPFILMRYADVLLIAAEAGVELSLAGVNSPVAGDDMLKVATDAINEIRERAGADLLVSDLTADNESRDIVRKERRKELAFEHKSKWDLRRWRVQHLEARDGFWGTQKDKNLISNDTQYRFRGLYPFYSKESGKYFFDARFQWTGLKTFDYKIIDYYFAIPGGQVAKSELIDQQPNR